MRVLARVPNRWWYRAVLALAVTSNVAGLTASLIYPDDLRHYMFLPGAVCGYLLAAWYRTLDKRDRRNRLRF